METIRNLQNSEGFKKASELLRVKKYEKAVMDFGMLLSKLVEEHGDLGTPVAPVYYAYGSACLEQVEHSANIFGDAVKHRKETEKGQEEVQDLSNETAQSQESATKAPMESKHEGQNDTAQNEDTSSKEKLAVIEDVQLDAIIRGLVEEFKKKHNKEPTEEVMKQWIETIKSATPSTLDSTSQQHSEKPSSIEAKQETANDLTASDIDELLGIAWECLEASRVIYTKLVEKLQGSSTEDANEDLTEAKKLLAKTLLRLGDHSMEIGRFDLAINDFEKCLSIRNEVYDKIDRAIPDVHSILATAYLYGSAEDTNRDTAKQKRFKALLHYLKATESLLGLRQKLLKLEIPTFSELKLEDVDDEDEDDSANQSKKPLTEVTAIVLNRKEKELLEMIKERRKHIEIILNQSSQTETESNTSIKEEQDISEILREMVLKVDDVVQVLENREASDAMTKSAEIVEKAMEEALESSGLDKPTLTTEDKDKPATSEPTNLLQARKKVESPEEVKVQVEGVESDKKIKANSLPVKRKADTNSTETASSKKIKA